MVDQARKLNAALAALSALGVEETPIVSLAKQEEEIYSPDQPVPLRLPRSDPGLQLLQQIRDESHRFAVARHRSRRASGTLRSRFDGLRGVGPRRKKALVQRFGSWRGLAAASREEVIEVLGATTGDAVYSQVHASDPAPDHPSSAPATR